MNSLFNCYHLKTIINQYTGLEQVVRCGKCNACRNQRAVHWVTRCDMESSYHKYCWFVNLSYNDFNVPQIVRLRHDDANHIVYIDSSTGELVDPYDVKEAFEDKDIQYCKDTKVLDILEKRDIQLFIKRLRYEFDKTQKGAKLRYYVAGEYGPRTYRPHYHCLIWFDSDRCNQQFEEMLHKTWTFGDIYQPHIVDGSAAKYVSSYINSFSSLPKIYLHKRICPFTLKSSSPAIGSLYPLLGSQQELTDGKTLTFRRFNPSSHKFEDVPFWRSLENRLYPRCQRFSSLSHDDRVVLYREMGKFVEGLDFLPAKDIAQRLKWEYLDNKRNDFLGRYLFEISHKTLYKFRFTRQPADVSGFKDLPFLPLNLVFSRPFTGMKTISREFCFDSLVRFVRCISCAVHNASTLNLSIENYLNLIEQYYDTKSNVNVKNDFRFQSDYFSTHPKWHFVYFDKMFYDKVTNIDFNCLTPMTQFYLNDWFNGDVPLKPVSDKKSGYRYVLDIPPFDSLDSYKSFYLKHEKIAHELIKQKSNNDYALQHKDRFFNVIRYQNL